MENTLLAWSVKSNTIYVGMPSINSISRNWGVLPHQCQCTNTNWYLIWPHLLEVNPPQTHMQHILVFGWVWSSNRCGHAEGHFQKTSCKVCFLISVSAPTPISTRHDHSWQKPHITCYIKVRVNFQVKAHQSLYKTLWHFQNCCCFLCLLATLMHPDLSLQVLHAQVDPTCMVTLGWWWFVPDHWFTQRSTHHPPVISTG